MTKTFIHRLAVVGALTVFSAAPAWSGQSVYEIDPSRSDISFSFRSTLHKVDGEAQRFRGTFNGRPGLLNHISDGVVTVDVAELDTGHPKRDANMFEMFELPRYPQISYQLKEVAGVPAVDGPAGQVNLKGTLKIRDLELPLEMPAVIIETGEGITLSGETDLSLQDFELTPPSVMMVIRVFDTVHVKFRVILKERAS